MKFAFWLSLIIFSYQAQAGNSEVFYCVFTEENFKAFNLRMKKYSDANTGELLGQIDLFEFGVKTESTKAKVFQIPLLDGMNMMQIWNGQSMRVDSQIKYDQGFKPFFATLNKNNSKLILICQKLAP